MVGSGHVDKGAIYSIAGDSKWAGSAGFEVRSTSAFVSLYPGLRNFSRETLEIGREAGGRG